jgi:hypothetical protein
MQIYFRRMGGFAGMRLSTTLDSQDLEEGEARALQDEVEQANFFDLPDRLQTSGGGADRFEYHITVALPGKEHSVVVSEAAMPDSLRPLVQHLELLMRMRRR